MEKILPISLKLNFTPHNLGSYGLNYEKVLQVLYAGDTETLNFYSISSNVRQSMTSMIQQRLQKEGRVEVEKYRNIEEGSLSAPESNKGRFSVNNHLPLNTGVTRNRTRKILPSAIHRRKCTGCLSLSSPRRITADIR